MNRRRIALFVLVALVPAACRAGELPKGEARAEGFVPETLEKIPALLREVVDQGRIAGAASLISRNGKVVQVATAGMADVEAKRPMGRSTIFRIASMSKPITSAAVMILVDDGKIKLDDPVSKFLPELASMTVLTPVDTDGAATVPAERPITIHQLLTHTSGLSYRFFNHPVLAPIYVENGVSDGLSETPGTIGDNIKRLARVPLLHQPGTAYDYSLSTDVLGRVIEVASGLSFDQFLKQRLLGPLKMDDTGFVVPPAKRGRLAALYGSKDAPGDPIERAPDTPIQVGALVFSGTFPGWDTGHYYSGGAGLTSTLDDYARFLQMILDGGELEGVRVLKPESVEKMVTHQIGDLRIPPGGHGEGFGYGFGVVLDGNRDHDPSAPGSISWAGFFQTYFWVDRKHKTIGILMTQLAPSRNSTIVPRFKALACEAIVD